MSMLMPKHSWYGSWPGGTTLIFHSQLLMLHSDQHLSLQSDQIRRSTAQMIGASPDPHRRVLKVIGVVLNTSVTVAAGLLGLRPLLRMLHGRNVTFTMWTQSHQRSWVSHPTPSLLIHLILKTPHFKLLSLHYQPLVFNYLPHLQPLHKLLLIPLS